MIYPSFEFIEQQSNAVENQQSIIADASEHFELLKQLAMTDLEYQRFLKLCKKRKTQVNARLKSCKTWSNLLRSIAQPK